jgi:hypothetical protein
MCVPPLLSPPASPLTSLAQFGLPRLITPSVLKEPQYQAFSVGVSVMFGLVLRFDRLVNATKALVGERYPITLDFNRTHAYRPTEYS